MKIKLRILNWLKVIITFIIFIFVVIMISCFNRPMLDTLTGEVATRYMEMPSGEYIGDAVLNTITGKGSFYFDTGEVYEGAWSDNEMSGKGKLSYTTGVYEGEFLSSKRSGQGKFTWNNGSIYEGTWLSDKINGKGKLISGNTVYEGNWETDVLNEGTITSKTNNATYKITVSGGIVTNHIDVKFSSGVTYEGEYYKNNISGSGTMTYPKVGKYVGKFSKGKREGQGTFTWDDGVSYKGNWNNDAMNGKGKYNLSNTTYLEGDFVNGTLNGKYTYHNEKGNYKTTWVNNTCTNIVEE